MAEESNVGSSIGDAFEWNEISSAAVFSSWSSSVPRNADGCADKPEFMSEKSDLVENVSMLNKPSEKTVEGNMELSELGV